VKGVTLALVMPRDPRNAGNAGRSVLGLGRRLLLVGPTGFSLDDRTLARARLDYWDTLEVETLPSWEAFRLRFDCQVERTWFFSSRLLPGAGSSRALHETRFRDGDICVLGSETSGLDSVTLPRAAQLVSIPKQISNMRSYNLAAAASMVLWESYRQLNCC
jgi:tRNA (cytidine/uridine-2'-O-)-methyltransferase